MTVSTYVLTNGANIVVTYPWSIDQMMAANPTVSYTVPVSDEIAAEYNTFPVIDTPQPSYDPLRQNINLLNPAKQDGIWVQQWSVTEATPEEQALRLEQFRAGLYCSPLQGKIELDTQGLLDAAESEIATADKITKLAWNNATIWYRTSPMVETLGSGLGLSADDLDNLFIAARKISV